MMSNDVSTSILNENGGYVEQEDQTHSVDPKNKAGLWYTRASSGTNQFRTPLLGAEDHQANQSSDSIERGIKK